MRKRLQLNTRTDQYYNLRFIWLHELRQLRAKRRVNGFNVRSEIKTIQRTLAKVRKEH